MLLVEHGRMVREFGLAPSLTVGDFPAVTLDAVRVVNRTIVELRGESNGGKGQT